MNVDVLLFLFNFTAAHYFVASLATFFSEYLVYLLPTTVILYIFLTEDRPFQKSAYIIIVLVLSVVLTEFVLKGFFGETRPFIMLSFTPLISAPGLSFPSGHATLSGALMLATIFTTPKPKFFAVFVSILCIGIGISRVMLGVHYPVDILVGFAVGFFISLIGYLFSRKYL